MTPAAERKAVAHLVDAYGMSERRACKTIGCCRMTIRYKTTRADDAGLRQRMKAIAQGRRRFGYRRLHVLLKREGYVINHKKLFRLYLEEKLAVRRRGGRKRAIGTRAPMMVPVAPNDRWSLDFVSDQLTDGRRFRILTVVDDLHTRVPGAGGRHLALRRPCGAGTGPADSGDGTEKRLDRSTDRLFPVRGRSRQIRLLKAQGNDPDQIDRSNANRDARTGSDGREAVRDCPQAPSGAGTPRHS